MKLPSMRRRSSTRVSPKLIWIGRRRALGLFAYWFILTGGAGVLARAGNPSSEVGWPTLITLGFVILFVATAHPRQWGGSDRFGFVFLTWLGQLVLSAPVALLYVLTTHDFTYVDRASLLLAGLPFVYIAMRKSRLFTNEVCEPDPGRLEFPELTS